MTVLKQLIIARAEWGKDRGKLSGKIAFISEYGETQLNLGEELSQRIVDICADELVKSAQALANDMSREVMTSAALMPPEE